MEALSPGRPAVPRAQISPGPPDTSPCAGTWSREAVWLPCHLVAALSLQHRAKLAGPGLGPKAACWEVTPVSEPLAPFPVSQHRGHGDGKVTPSLA